MRRDPENSEEQTKGHGKLSTVCVNVVPITFGFEGLGNANSIYTVHRDLAQHQGNSESGRQETDAAMDNDGRYHGEHPDVFREDKQVRSHLRLSLYPTKNLPWSCQTHNSKVYC